MPKSYYCHSGSRKKPCKKNKPKMPNQNGQVQINLSKMAFWSSWTWEQKNHMGVFLTEILCQKNLDFL
jgi:hypothetical protein